MEFENVDEIITALLAKTLNGELAWQRGNYTYFGDLFIGISFKDDPTIYNNSKHEISFNNENTNSRLHSKVINDELAEKLKVAIEDNIKNANLIFIGQLTKDLKVNNEITIRF